jgi:hypothetical protein
MAITHTGKSVSSVLGTLTEPSDLGSNQAATSGSALITWTSGSDATAAQRVWGDTRTLAASASEALDLAGGLTSGLGGTLTFTAIKELWLKAHEDNGSTITLGAAAANGWAGPFGATTHTLTLPAGGVVHLIAPTVTGWPVTAGTGDLLKVANNDSAASASYSLVLRGLGS